jgi:hypothetical protein
MTFEGSLEKTEEVALSSRRFCGVVPKSQPTEAILKVWAAHVWLRRSGGEVTVLRNLCNFGVSDQLKSDREVTVPTYI